MMDQAGTIYYICCPETSRVKIGFTTNRSESRLKALQTGSPTQLYLIAEHSGTQRQEKELHEKFQFDRLHGEWFESSDRIIEHIAMVCWLAGAEARDTGRTIPLWVRVGLNAMNEYNPLPDEMMAVIK